MEETSSLSSIQRLGQRRYLTVTGTVDPEYNITLVSAAAQEALKQADLGEGVDIVFSGENETIMEAVEQLRCRTAGEALAGALYACLTSHRDFDAAMITAVNHSGRSAAVGAVTGALLGAMYGEEVLPGHWLEQLECAGVLRELAADLFGGCPMMKESRVFDIEWDEKYHVTEL